MRNIPAGASFAMRLGAWQAVHGRHALPWQQTRDPYRVWLSEVMLQQTQVATVLTYFARFLAHFPDVFALAAADEDQVLALWSGMGYYSRARNLHRCAQAVAGQHGGTFPSDAATLEKLPGIGPSTAAAIAAFCFNERISILDGNVLRLLARWAGIGADMALATTRRDMQSLANGLLPTDSTEMPAHTQGLMDLGAGICTPRNPACNACPLVLDCVARINDLQTTLPFKTRRVVRKTVGMHFLIAQRSDGCVALERRSSTGIWAGMHCFPAYLTEESMKGVLGDTDARAVQTWPSFTHVLTHRDLVLHPHYLKVPAKWGLTNGATASLVWVSPGLSHTLGIPKPVAQLFQSLNTTTAAVP
jgi:A/G-specific adenine glycosylase